MPSERAGPAPPPDAGRPVTAARDGLPAWLRAPARPGVRRDLEVAAPGLGGTVGVSVWAPADSTSADPLPLLAVHDGPAYDTRACFTRYLSAGIAAGWLPPLRAALLTPGDRDSWYSASAGYADALARAVLPAVTAAVRTTTIAGMGTSLGALAMLHAHGRHPGLFSGLFLQSGSFFWPHLDGEEQWFPHFRRIARFTAALSDAGRAGLPVPVVLTCGLREENLANNRLTARQLSAAGYPATLHEVPGGHDFAAWRDALHPALTDLLRLVAAERSCSCPPVT